MPVALLLKYNIDDNPTISLALSERFTYKQTWREGEKVGKVIILKDIDTQKPHSAHLRILFGDNNGKSGLKIDSNKIRTFKALHEYWQTQFSIQALNNQFYSDLQQWFYFATQHIKLPYKPDYISEKENVKNFIVRLLSRTMFCWFIKEKGLIQPELLELTDWNRKPFSLTYDVNTDDFSQSNSYYRGILQNIFFNSLNQQEKKSAKDFKWMKYLHPDFNFEWFTKIPLSEWRNFR
jgi:hypothetical protein